MPTANSQQPTANSQQPTANSQQPTANSQIFAGKKKLILEASIDRVIKDRGKIHTKSMAKQLKISEGTIFRYFESKEILHKEVCAYLVSKMLVCFQAEGLFSSDQGKNYFRFTIPVRQRLRILWDVYLEWGLQHSREFQAFQFFEEAQQRFRSLLEKEIRLCVCLHKLSTQQDLLEMFPSWHFEFASHFLISIADATIMMALKMPNHAVRQLRETSFISFLYGLDPYFHVYAEEKERAILGCAS